MEKIFKPGFLCRNRKKTNCGKFCLNIVQTLFKVVQTCLKLFLIICFVNLEKLAPDVGSRAKGIYIPTHLTIILNTFGEISL